MAAGRVGEVHGHDRVGAQGHARVELWPVSAARNARSAIMNVSNQHENTKQIIGVSIRDCWR